MFVTGCATTLDVANTSLAAATHKDLQAAAAYAQANGYPARAAVRLAIDAQLTACENAITAAIPRAPVGGIVGPIMAAEMAEEAAGSGVPAAVRVNCAPLPLIRLPGLP